MLLLNRRPPTSSVVFIALLTIPLLYNFHTLPRLLAPLSSEEDSKSATRAHLQTEQPNSSQPSKQRPPALVDGEDRASGRGEGDDIGDIAGGEQVDGNAGLNDGEDSDISDDLDDDAISDDETSRYVSADEENGAGVVDDTGDDDSAGDDDLDADDETDSDVDTASDDDMGNGEDPDANVGELGQPDSQSQPDNFASNDEANSQIPADILPPPIAPLVEHHQRPAKLPEERPDWKRPAILTAYARPASFPDKVTLTIFSTGTDTQLYGRVFIPVACLVANRVYPISLSHPELTECSVDRPKKGDNITILLRLDDALQSALVSNYTKNSQVFEIRPGDIVPYSGTPVPNEPKVARVGSSVVWSDSLLDDYLPKDIPSQPRYEMCIMTAMKQYPYLLDGFIQFYRRAGVDQIFIFDNMAAIDLHHHMRHHAPFVQVVYWPWTRSQMQSFNFFLRASRPRCKYVAYFDADEYIMTAYEGRNTFRNYIRYRMETQRYNQVVALFIRMLNNGYIRMPTGDIPLLYTRREKNQTMRLGKAVVDNDIEYLWHKIHMVKARRGAKNYWNTTWEFDPKTYNDSAMLVHYTERSWEEYVLKRRFGGSTPMTSDRNPEELDVDKPTDSYMNLSKTVEFDGLARRWNVTMQEKLPEEMIIVRLNKTSRCRREVCPTCHEKAVREEHCEALR